MPEPPAGEAGLRDIATRFASAEGFVMVLLAEAAVGNRATITKMALERLAELRLLDHKQAVVDAYLHEHPKGRPDAVRDLAGSLAKRLDQGAKTASDGVRDTFRRVTKDNLDALLMSPLTAAVDAGGSRWALGHWAQMNTETIGRTATSRGLAHAVGEGGKVVVNVGRCQLCQSHAGEAVIGQQPLPPYHPSCTCVATAA
ncbi:MAG: hypothetical protein M3N43_07750 [Actinomycetota bacterium]|nr:hypothetical protein [Actinomycetota bacterium]